jgi:hypothetical protein
MSTKRHTARNFNNINNRLNSANLAPIVFSTFVSISATGGDTITDSNNYRYHTFLNSGVFSVTVAPGSPTSATIDVLLVGGGGGGGGTDGNGTGGGGAGGWVSANLLVSPGPYTVTIGGGGIGSTNDGGASQTQGTPTTFPGITTAVGGGKGGNRYTNGAGPGGSGGGGSVFNAGATGTPNQGYPGGDGVPGPGIFPAGGGGGGAGGAGSPYATTTSTANGGGAAGGPGKAWNSVLPTAPSVVYAGGGGGSREPGIYSPVAPGGGGSGGNPSLPVRQGQVNTGGGGGAAQGAGVQAGGASGGKGIVIVRYPLIAGATP